MKNILLLLGVLAMLCSGCEYTSNKLTNNGLERLYKQDYKGAIADFNKAIAIHGKNPTAYYNRGLARYSLQDRKGALADFDKAIELEPIFSMAYYNRAIAKTDAKDYEGAIADYHAAATIDPTAGKALYNSGQLKIEIKNYAGAMDDLTRAITAAKKDTEAHVYLAKSYINRGLSEYFLNDNRRALADLDSALMITPADIDALYNTGYIKYGMGDYSGATAAFNTILKINPKYGVAVFYNGLADIKQGYKDIGCGELDKASRLGVAEAADTMNKYCR